LTLKKIRKIGATRCLILRLKCTKFDFRWAPCLRPRPRWGSFQHSPDLAVFKWTTSKEREGERGREGGNEGERRGGEERGSGLPIGESGSASGLILQ